MSANLQYRHEKPENRHLGSVGNFANKRKDARETDNNYSGRGPDEEQHHCSIEDSHAR